MKYLKKVSSVPLEQTEGHIIDSFNTSDDHTTNAPSLNAVENNYVSKPIVLYNNPSGTNGNITLSDSVANYSTIEIYFHTNDGAGYRGCQKVPITTGTSVASLQYIHCNTSTNWWIKAKSIAIYGTNIQNNGYVEVFSGGQTASNYIYIEKVLGYK